MRLVAPPAKCWFIDPEASTSTIDEMRECMPRQACTVCCSTGSGTGAGSRGAAAYATPAGWEAIGYVGNVALPKFDGPPAEVLAKLGVTQTVG